MYVYTVKIEENTNYLDEVSMAVLIDFPIARGGVLKWNPKIKCGL